MSRGRIGYLAAGFALALLLPGAARGATGGAAAPAPVVGAGVVSASADTTTSVYRFYNRATGTHFYTASEAERASVILGLAARYRLEGVAYTIGSASGRANTPLYRFYNRRAGTHFYTASQVERADVAARLSHIYTYEGPAYNVIGTPAEGDVPVYRFYNVRGGTHFYTASTEERDRVATALAGIYRLEGIAFYVSSASREARPPIVCIDPGHQARANLSPEPIGPGSSITKPKVAGGTTGIVTRLPEYHFALLVSLKLKQRLEARGVTVVMTRESDAVDISNAQRAQIANLAGADLFVRVHADGSTNTGVHGLSTLYPSGNSWVAPIEAPSVRAARLVHDATVANTGAANRGIVGRSDMTGFNWSCVPAIIVECGFMTNPTEDRLLASDAYQDRLADGMAAGILTYVGR